MLPGSCGVAVSGAWEKWQLILARDE